MNCADPLHAKVFPCPTCTYDGDEPDGAPVYGLYSETDAELMAPRVRGARAMLMGRWTVEEWPASHPVPAHFRLLLNGQLVGWGPVEFAPAIIALARISAAAFKLIPSELLAAELADDLAPAGDGLPSRGSTQIIVP